MAALRSAARTSPYRDGTPRTHVPDELVPWTVPFDGYAPVSHTSPHKYHEDLTKLAWVLWLRHSF